MDFVMHQHRLPQAESGRPTHLFPQGAISLVVGTALIGHFAYANTVQIADSSFRCIRQMTPVRHFYVDNLLGNVAGTVAAANAPQGAVYPEGSVVQLVPTEGDGQAGKGFNPATGDWEFFELRRCQWHAYRQARLCRSK